MAKAATRLPRTTSPQTTRVGREPFRFDYQLIPADKHQPIRRGTVVMSAKPAWEELDLFVADHLDCCTPMKVGLIISNEERDMFIDGIASMKELPRNELATSLYRANYLAKHPGTDPEKLPFICGPAILFDEQVWFDD